MKFLNFLLNFAVNLNLLRKKVYLKGEKNLDFPGGPLVKTLPFQCRGNGFEPWSDPHAIWCGQKNF